MTDFENEMLNKVKDLVYDNGSWDDYVDLIKSEIKKAVLETNVMITSSNEPIHFADNKDAVLKKRGIA